MIQQTRGAISGYRLPTSSGYSRDDNNFIDFLQSNVCIYSSISLIDLSISLIDHSLISQYLSLISQYISLISLLSQFSCCGVSGPEDWENTLYANTTHSFPTSCACLLPTDTQTRCELVFSSTVSASFLVWNQVWEPVNC